MQLTVERGRTRIPNNICTSACKLNTIYLIKTYSILISIFEWRTFTLEYSNVVNTRFLLRPTCTFLSSFPIMTKTQTINNNTEKWDFHLKKITLIEYEIFLCIYFVFTECYLILSKSSIIRNLLSCFVLKCRSNLFAQGIYFKDNLH